MSYTDIDKNHPEEFKVYDYDELHPQARGIAVTILSVLTFISFCCILLSKFAVITILAFLFFLVVLIRNAPKKNTKKRIVFEGGRLQIHWNLFFKAVKEDIPSSRISKIRLRSYPHRRYAVEIYLIDDNVIKFDITMIQHRELTHYFQEFSQTHEIDFSRYNA